jgi:hypothetical protein
MSVVVNKISLTKGKYVIVDDEDYEYLNQFTWQLSKGHYTNYAIRTYRKKACKRKTMRMHRVIMNPPSHLQIDHKDGNGLNNQKENLRICTQSQNIGNRGVMKNNTSGVKGVHWDKNAKKWRARLGMNGKRKCLGIYDDLDEAKDVYIKAAKEFFGEYYNDTDNGG